MIPASNRLRGKTARVIGPTDREVAEKRQDDPDRKGDRVDEVDVGEDEVDQDRMDVGAASGEKRPAVLAQPLDHSSCPAPPLSGEALHVFGRTW